MGDATEIDFVLAFWDVPREGVTLIDDQLHYFKADFDEELDDYSRIYRVVPLPSRFRDDVLMLRTRWYEGEREYCVQSGQYSPEWLRVIHVLLEDVQAAIVGRIPQAKNARVHSCWQFRFF